MARPETSAPHPLDDVNAGFHDRYDAARDAQTSAVPVLILLGDDLFFHHAGQRVARRVVPPEAGALRSVAHAPVALFATLDGLEGALPARTTEALRGLRERLSKGPGTLPGALPEAGPRSDAEEVLRESIAFASETLEAARVTPRALDAFAARLGPLLLRLTEHATRYQLQRLHAEASAIWQTLSSPERDRLQVIVAGAHQARQRSLGLQYFQKRLGESPEREERVVYAENVTEEREALALVGTRRMDRAMAQAFFGDPRRLQRDILGDAAAAQLATATF